MWLVQKIGSSQPVTWLVQETKSNSNHVTTQKHEQQLQITTEKLNLIKLKTAMHEIQSHKVKHNHQAAIIQSASFTSTL